MAIMIAWGNLSIRLCLWTLVRGLLGTGNVELTVIPTLLVACLLRSREHLPPMHRTTVPLSLLLFM